MNNENIKILVVDDEENIRTLLFDMLSLKGYTIKTAETALEAIDEFKELKPHIVLLDLKLGKANGIDVLKQMKDINPTAIVIIITAYGSPETDLNEIKLGAYGEIGKPFDINIIEQVINNAIESHKERN
ncbi:MAG: response regulator [Candidatus Ancaeobacter aquaticus]|nr:response regulator [Candidatus Ancaeobacter aquaticus]